MNCKQAKQIPLDHFIESLGYQPTKSNKYENWYCSPFRDEKTASFKVNKILNTWHDHGHDSIKNPKNGGDIINFVIEKYDDIFNTKKALEKIESIMGGASCYTAPKKRAKPTKPKKTPEIKEIIKPLFSLPLLNYLNQKRKIDIPIIKKYLFEIHYTFEGKNYFTAGFKNDSGGYETRNSIFKGCLLKKDITTIQGEKDSKTVFIFEGFLDFLSYLTYKKKLSITDHIIILNSIELSFLAIEKIRELSPSDLRFYLDNDEAGERAKEKIINETNLKGHSQNTYYSEYNDLNDFIRGIKINSKTV